MPERDLNARSEFWSVDRIEGAFAVCENDHGAKREIPLSQLPAGVREGDVLFQADGRYTLAPQETRRRKEAVLKLQKRLFRS